MRLTAKCQGVINVDKNRAYLAAVDALKAEGVRAERVELRPCKYRNNIMEQDHRAYSGEVGHPFRWHVGRVKKSQPQV